VGNATVQAAVKSGGFLFEDQRPSDIFTREDVSEEQRLFARTAEQFLREEVHPRADEIYAKDWSVSRQLLRKAGDLDLLRADIPEKYGGLGLDKISSALIAEQTVLNPSFAATMSAHSGIGTWPIVYFGTPEQRAKYLPRIASGELVAAFALTEPGSGSDALAARTKATLSADGKHYTLRGQKMWITNGGLADVFTVFAKVDGEKFTAFIVERGPGLVSGNDEKKLGLDGSSTTALMLEDCRVPVENVLGEVGRGHVVAFNTLNLGRLKLGNRNIAMAKLALNHAIVYAIERHQFGRAIASFELIKRKLGDMATRCYTGDAMAFRLVGVVDNGLEAIDQADPAQVMKVIEQYAMECSIIKVWTSETLGWVADEGLQVLGGYGYSRDYPLERIVRDARITRIYEGTNEINRMLVTTRFLKSVADGKAPLESAFEQSRAAGIADGHSGDLESAVKVRLVEAKRTALAALHAASRAFGGELKERQEALALVADILIDTYAMESAWLRTAKLREKRGAVAAKIPLEMAVLYASDAADRIAVHARDLSGTLASRGAGEEVWEAAQRLCGLRPADTVALRQSIADAVIAAQRYLW
jgi:alkylation response protein AidB-like acyl-CoA dehydrogenase